MQLFKTNIWIVCEMVLNYLPTIAYNYLLVKCLKCEAKCTGSHLECDIETVLLQKVIHTQNRLGHTHTHHNDANSVRRTHSVQLKSKPRCETATTEQRFASDITSCGTKDVMWVSRHTSFDTCYSVVNVRLYCYRQ